MGRPLPSTPNRTLASCLEQLRAAGFEIREQSGGRLLVSRSGCAAVLLNTGAGVPQVAVGPGVIQGEGIAHLLDCGFQKFWQDGDRKRPALAEELKALHRFQRDLRAALGLTTLYNEAIGTVSSKYVYDRLEGRAAGQRHPCFD